MENDIVFLGGLLPKEIEDEIRENSIGNVQNAANNLQWEIVNGLDINNGEPIKIINSLFIGSFPKRYKKLVINTSFFSHNYSSKKSDINVGFFNLTGIKNICRYLSIIPHINKWAKQDNGKKKVVIAYAMTATFTRILRYVKKNNPNIITCLIVPDLPEYMNLSKKNNLAYKILKSIEVFLIRSDKKHIDSYVLLTKHMRKALDIQVPSIVLEGVSTNLFDEIKVKTSEKQLKKIVYTGGINEKYGVLLLLDAFKRMKSEDYRLIFCGAGDAEKEIIEYASMDNRVIFEGLVDRKRALEIQKSATVLVNPRTNNQDFTKYSFPSKILEYLSSGTPVLSYRLDGIPDEYFNYIYSINEEEDGLYKALNYVLTKPEAELRERGLAGREFVLSHKNSQVQTARIVNMINSIRS